MREMIDLNTQISISQPDAVSKVESLADRARLIKTEMDTDTTLYIAAYDDEFLYVCATSDSYGNRMILCLEQYSTMREAMSQLVKQAQADMQRDDENF